MSSKRQRDEERSDEQDEQQDGGSKRVRHESRETAADAGGSKKPDKGKRAVKFHDEVQVFSRHPVPDGPSPPLSPSAGLEFLHDEQAIADQHKDNALAQSGRFVEKRSEEGARFAQRLREEDQAAALEPLSMAEELESGFIDENGDFKQLRSRRELRKGRMTFDAEGTDESISDPWLKELDVEKPEALDKQISFSIKKTIDTETAEIREMSIEELKRNIAKLLRYGETVMKAFARSAKEAKELGGGGSAASRRLAAKKNRVSSEQLSKNETQLKKIQQDNTRLTTLANVAFEKGYNSVYDIPREQLETEKNDEILMWEYKSPTDPGAEIYGPYTTTAMEEWRTQNYFDGDTVMLVRLLKNSAPITDFVRSDTISFTTMSSEHAASSSNSNVEIQ